MRHVVNHGPYSHFYEGPMGLGWWIIFFKARALFDRAAYKSGEQLWLIA